MAWVWGVFGIGMALMKDPSKWLWLDMEICKYFHTNQIPQRKCNLYVYL